MAPTGPDAAVILAGGAGRRLGTEDKPQLTVGGRPMLRRVLAAVPDAGCRVVVGPPRLALPPGVVRTRERPAGGGPAAATAAGWALLPPDAAWVALLAADLPLLTRTAVDRLWRTVADRRGRYDGAVYVDDTGAPQWLCGVWRAGAVRARRAELPADLTGVPLRRLLAGLRVARVTTDRPVPPWWDCDTETELRQAREWSDGDA